MRIIGCKKVRSLSAGDGAKAAIERAPASTLPTACDLRRVSGGFSDAQRPLYVRALRAYLGARFEAHPVTSSSL
jgi:hypothetical protein